jgi:signal transduction histidine kinase
MPKATLMVVEDEMHLLNGIRDILELDDYAVITARHGKEALELLQHSETPQPDLIVSDIMMPYMDGLSLLEAVRGHQEWVLIPFIFLTAKGERADVQRGKKLGVDDYLIKPFDAEDLLIAVEARLRRHSALNEAQAGAISEIKQDIITILNHEMRTPLTLVVAYADMLKDFGNDEMSQDELLTFLRGVNSGAERLRRLIENFILVVEMESGDARRTFGWRSHPIQDLDKIIMAAHDQIMSDPNVHHVCNVQIEAPLPTIIGDRDYLMVIVRELLDNAVKFSSPDAPVTLKARPGNGVMRLQVIDGGRGIPESEFENIWKTFYQIDREHFEDQGAGSGLAIVRNLVDIHGGEVKVESQVGHGSIFTVSLPVAKP